MGLASGKMSTVPRQVVLEQTSPTTFLPGGRIPTRARERRKSARFALTFPVQILKLSKERVELEGETRNVSSAGAYFILDDDRLALGAPVEFLVDLAPGTDAQGEPPLRLRCRGRVTRIDDSGDERCVAATIDRYKFVHPA